MIIPAFCCMISFSWSFQKIELPQMENIQTIPPPFVVRTLLIFSRHAGMLQFNPSDATKVSLFDTLLHKYGSMTTTLLFWLMWMIATLKYNSHWGNLSCKITLCLDSCWNYRIVSMKVCRTTVNVTLAFVLQINVVQPTMCRNNRKTKQEVKEDP